MGYDALANLVLDDCVEELRAGAALDAADGGGGNGGAASAAADATRKLGLVVCRGTTVMLISPADGAEEIANPFAAQQQ